jgi:hypothetical protein
MTSMVVNALTTSTPAIPSGVIYKERPAIEQVNPKELARELLTSKQYLCFTKLVGKESAWKNVKNPSSSARGVGQLLASTYRNLGMKHSEARVAQTVAALAYIGRKYGSSGPCGAWKHFQTHSWY